MRHSSMHDSIAHIGKPDSIALAPLVRSLGTATNMPFTTPAELAFVPKTGAQRIFVEEFLTNTQRAIIPPDLIKLLVSASEEELQRFLDRSKLKLKIPALVARRNPGAPMFGIAGAMKISGGFVNAKKGTMRTRHGKFRRVLLENDVSFFRSPVHHYPIIQIQTNNTQIGDNTPSSEAQDALAEFEHYAFDWQMYLTRLDHPLRGVELARQAKLLAQSLRKDDDSGYSSASIPFVRLKQEVDLSWLQDFSVITAEGLEASCEFALQSNAFELTEHGFQLSSSSAFGMAALCAPEEGQRLDVDEPFLLWIRKQDCPEILFAAYLPPETWVGTWF